MEETQMKKMKDYCEQFIKEAVNEAKFDELPNFLWDWDEFLFSIINKKVNKKNFTAFWSCINRSLTAEHYGALIDKGITFEMMEVMEMNTSLFEAGLKRPWFHKEMVRYMHLLDHHQMVKLFVEGELDKKSLDKLYDSIIEAELTPTELVQVMCKCQNKKLMKECVDTIPDEFWRNNEFLELLAKGKAAYTADDLDAILMKIITNQICFDLNKIVDIFGYEIFIKVFETDEVFQKVQLYAQTMNEGRDMRGKQWNLLIDAYNGDIDKALEDLKRYGYVPTKSQMEALKEANEAE